MNASLNTVLDGPEGASDSVLRHYFGRDLEAALTAWGTLDGQVAALTTARQIIARLIESEGAVFEVYFRERKSELVVLFEHDTDRAGAWINWGHVDHRAQLLGSDASPHGWWRTFLPTSDGPASLNTRATAEIRHRTCPQCFMPVPPTGICDTCDL